MRNSDMPATPLSSPDSSIVSISEMDHEFIKQCNGAVGLTKREYFAGFALQGIMASDGNSGAWITNATEAVEKAVEYADALLEELEKTS